MMNHRGFYWGCLAALFFASFLAFYSVYDYVIAFQSETNDGFFLFGKHFFLDFLDHPAAPVRYAGRFLAQFYYYRAFGALVVAASVTCFGVLFGWILTKRKKTVAGFQVLLPCILLLALHTSTFVVLQDTLGLCISCLAFVGYLSLPSTGSRRVYALIMTPIVYLLAGFYVVILVAWVAAADWFDAPRRSRLAFTAAYLAWAMAIPVIGWRWIFPIPLRSALLCPLIFTPPFRSGWADQNVARFVADGILAGALGVALLLMPFWNRVVTASPLVRFWDIGPDWRRRLALMLSMIVFGGLCFWVLYDARLAKILACRQLYKQRQWDVLLKTARDNTYGDHRIQFMTNFALYQQGKLLDEMFAYPQPYGTRGLFLNFSGTNMESPTDDDTDDGMLNSDLLFEMGHVNFALQHAHNSLALQGETYENLARMAQCSMVNGNEAMARKYLKLLEMSLFHQDVARRHRAILADPALRQKKFGVIRQRLPTVDGFGHPTRHFLVLLESKPDNRMAFDYLMAWLLLEKTPDAIESICADMIHLRDVGRSSIPKHCQEAMLLKTILQTGELAVTAVDTYDWDLDAKVTARVEKFWHDMSGQGVWLDSETAAELYGDTYMHYWFFAKPQTGMPSMTGPDSRYGMTTREE